MTIPADDRLLNVATMCARGWWPWPSPWWQAVTTELGSRGQVRRRCRRLIRGYDVPRPFHLDKFRRGLENTRGRRIMLVPVRTTSRSPCGLWIATEDTDYVFVDGATSPLHQTHIVLHELGHMVGDHQGISPFGEEFLRSALPNLDPRVARRALGRTAFTARQEQEAEMFATLIGERGEIVDVAPSPIELPPDTAQMLARLAAGLTEARNRNR